MLTTETKRKIDNLRDTLVGRIPVPSQQVELITLGLIYKFMSDIDEQNLEIGAKDSFFNGKYKQYAWSHIIDRSLSGQERTVLFAEGLEKMASNPNLPQLFRDIFKGAYLPFKDPVVLDHFLKGVNELSYTHSEELGNAFEYLLSVMGSQGDAGQFRTPRHVIDFLVKAVNPKKDDTILDPACGTAGFLISAYKHILEENTKKGGHPGSALSATDRQRLTKNFQGYDISHNMVQLSLVNLYLHNFPEPKIFEYDTLSDDTRWDHTFDCILANPPFMSPRGGIRPHNRFSVQSKRSEVLFVDYIAEHLNPNGKAGVIVPEGIVFNNDNTYKRLRKMLVEENYLWAVVSLPSGLFNPYAGVKTSILLFDKTVAKKTNKVLFVDVQKDGYGLGAQRRALCNDVENPAWCPEHSDLPKALEVLNGYKQAVLGEKPEEAEKLVEGNKTIIGVATKKEIAEDENYSLNASKYKISDNVYDGDWPLVELNKVCEIKKGSAITKKIVKKGDVPVIAGGQSAAYYHNEANREPDVITVSASGAYSGFVAYFDIPIFASDCTTLQSKDDEVLNKYIFYVLKGMQEDIYKLQKGGGQPHVYPKDIQKIKIPLPPIEVQKEIVAELESYQKIIDGARQIIDNYKPSITINPEWDIVPISDVSEINPSKSEVKDKKDDLDVSFVPMSVVSESYQDFEPKETRKKKDVYSGYTYFKDKDVLLAKVTPCFENGKSGIARNLKNGVGFGSTEFIVLRPDTKKVFSEWLYHFISKETFLREGKKHMRGAAGQKRIPSDYVGSHEIPVPSKTIQEEVLAEISKEREYIKNAQEMEKLFENKIKEKVSEVWGDKE